MGDITSLFARKPLLRILRWLSQSWISNMFVRNMFEWFLLEMSCKTWDGRTSSHPLGTVSNLTEKNDFTYNVCIFIVIICCSPYPSLPTPPHTHFPPYSLWVQSLFSFTIVHSYALFFKCHIWVRMSDVCPSPSDLIFPFSFFISSFILLFLLFCHIQLCSVHILDSVFRGPPWWSTRDHKWCQESNSSWLNAKYLLYYQASFYFTYFT